MKEHLFSKLFFVTKKKNNDVIVNSSVSVSLDLEENARGCFPSVFSFQQAVSRRSSSHATCKNIVRKAHFPMLSADCSYFL